MPMATIRHYLSELPKRQAEWRMMLVEAASFPHLTPSARRNLSRKIEEALGQDSTIRRPTVGQLMMVGIGTVFVSLSAEKEKSEPN